MTTTRLASIALCATIALSCGKGGDDKQDKATSDKPSATDAKPAAAAKQRLDAGKAATGPTVADAAPAADSPAAKQCQRIMEKTWQATKSVLVELGRTDADSLKARYMERGKQFATLCVTLSKAKRDCVEKADNAANAMFSCKVNAGRKKKLWAVSMGREVKLFEPKPLSPAEAKQRLASVVGTWTSTWKSLGLTTRWIIGPDGKGTMKRTRRGKTEKPQPVAVAFKQTGRIHITKGSTTQPYVYFRGNKNTFYVSSNLIYGAYPIPNRNKFIVPAGWDFVIYNRGKCKVVSGRGAVAKATCRFGRDKGKPVFKVEYQYPGKLGFTGKPVVSKRTYHVVGKHLLHESLVSIGTYRRKS